MDTLTAMLIGIGIGILIGIIYAQVQAWLIADRYEGKLRHIESEIKTAFTEYMRGE